MLYKCAGEVNAMLNQILPFRRGGKAAERNKLTREGKTEIREGDWGECGLGA